MFKAIAKLLAAREPPKPKFIPPNNKDTEGIAAFRASLHARGLTETEASALIVHRVLAGMWYLESRGYTFSQICDMPGSRLLAKPTQEQDYYDYQECYRRGRDIIRLRTTFGLD